MMTISILAEWLPTEMFATEASRTVLVLLLFTAIFTLAEGWHRLLHPPEEWTRKFVHIFCGIITASFHWIFSSNWPVITIGLITAVCILLARHFRFFRSIFGIPRHSHGDLYYLIAAVALFVITHDHPIFYFISMLTLTISDALAAILGSTYQRMTYSVEEHYKSIEGSVVFFLSTFLIVHIPLLLLTDTDRIHCILIALQVSLLVTYLEAICLNGIDNILIPFGTYYLLLTFTNLDPSQIISLLSYQFIILIAANIIAWKLPFFTMSGGMTIQLFLFWALILGGPQWLIAPLLALMAFIVCLMIFHHRIPQETLKVYQVVAVFYEILIPALLILARDIYINIDQTTTALENSIKIYALYVGVMSGQLAIALFRLFWIYSGRLVADWTGMFLLSLFSAALILPASLLFQPALSPDIIIFTISTALLIPFLYCLLKTKIEANKFPWEFRIQALCSFLALLIIIPLYLWIYTR